LGSIHAFLVVYVGRSGALDLVYGLNGAGLAAETAAQAAELAEFVHFFHLVEAGAEHHYPGILGNQPEKSPGAASETVTAAVAQFA
jgi:hypothetical protein